ncbi:ABC transporter permease [Actinoplanes sp. NPDC089786]|uniref:ABC transporter permease n=1 Tax=Actinoplanes sp. NPDC089786 TaxID=3155185 RepID=UPI0034290AF3
MTAVDTRTESISPTAPAHRVAPIPIGRLIGVELRKLADTRAGMWLLIIIGLASVATGLIQLFATPDDSQTFAAYFGFAQLPAGILLPVLGILSMTSEWSQRTALTTFTLVPQRGRVLAAKLLAAAAIAVVAAACTVAFAAVFNLIGSGLGGDGSWSIGWQVVAQCVLMQVLYVLMGSAFGALLMNTPVAIVGFFALPMVWTILGSVITSLQKASAWLDINTTTGPLTEHALTGGEWSRLGVSAAVWVLVPLVAGAFRMLRREVS